MSEEKTPDESCRSAQSGELRLGVAGNGDLRWAVADVGAPLEEVRGTIDLSPIAAVALGRALAAAALLLRFSTKVSGHLLLEIAGDGPLGKVTAEVDGWGYMRGLVGTPQLATPKDGRMSIAAAVGKGMMKVTWRNQRGERYESQVELVSGEIGKDLVHFLHQSQQIRSAALLGVLPKPTGIAEAGGMLIEAFPGVKDSVLRKVEKNIAELGGGVSAVLAEGGVGALLDTVLHGLDREEYERHELHYGCGRGRASLLDKLRHLTPEDIAAIVDERGHFTATCAFCGRGYTYSNDELLSDSGAVH